MVVTLRNNGIHLLNQQQEINNMFQKIREYYYSNCSRCGSKELVEVFGDFTAEVKKYNKCKCQL